MKLTANLSMLFTEVPLLMRFELAKKAGFDAVEIQFPYDTPVAQIKEQLDKHNLQCVLINVPAGDLMEGGEGLASVPGKEAEFTAALVECLSYVSALKVECVNVLPGRCMQPERQDEYLTTFKKNLVTAADMLQQVGVTVVFEAINTFDMPGFLINTVEQQLDIKKELNHSNLKIQFDVYHMVRMRKKNQFSDVTEYLARNGKEIGHIQFADVPGRGEPGSGMLDFNTIFHAINQSDYQGWVGAEYKPSAHTKESFGWKNMLASGVAMCS